MRAFIALELPGAFEEQASFLARQLGTVVEGRFMRCDTYHVTLAFLGECDGREIAGATSAIEDTCLLSSSRSPEGIPLKPCGLGKFGRAADATLWLGLECNDAIMGLAHDVRESLRSKGVGFDDKAFKPHITLARRARIPKVGLPPLPFPDDAMATRVALFSSTLSKEGASYKELHSCNVAIDG